MNEETKELSDLLYSPNFAESWSQVTWSSAAADGRRPEMSRLFWQNRFYDTGLGTQCVVAQVPLDGQIHPSQIKLGNTIIIVIAFKTTSNLIMCKNFVPNQRDSTQARRQGGVHFLEKWEKMTKRPYLGPWASNQKIKTTLFPSTFKIEGNKVVLFFRLDTLGLRYGHFVFL